MKFFSPNSPFTRDWFTLKEARRWVRKGKARMLNGELVFNDELREMMLRVTERELEAKEKEKAEEDFVDVSRTGGTGAIGEWSSRPSGGSSKMPGGPVSKSRQMKIVRRRKKK